MARPRSSSKAPNQRAGPSSGKRKHGGGPHGGGAGGRPAKQSRGEGRVKPADNDVYEAEDSDPDEVKHAERFDQVDNYEYELPSDFEDEEIDDELAFTEEDKKKFGSWFEKEVSGDEDEGAIIGDDDGEDWGDEEAEDEEEDQDNGPGGRDDAEADADGDLFLDDDDEDEDDDDSLGDDDAVLGEGDGDDDERHRAMLREVLDAAGIGEGARKRARRDPNAAVVSEAYPESEYNLNPGSASSGGAAGSLSIVDLLRGLEGEERRRLGAARRLLEKVAGGARGGEGEEGGRKGGKGPMKPVAVPLPAVVADRQERKAGYEAAAQDVTKWQSIVKANREAPTLRLVAGREEVPRITTTAALVAQHTPSADNALEAEVAALLQAAGAESTEAIEEAEEKLALKALTLEEARERRQRLAKLRSLLFYHELKSRRLKSIKSKEYHRHLSRASKRKATKLAAAAADGGGDAGSVDAERAAAIEAEFQRAKERLTLRHRNSSRWARRALKRGQLDVDPGTKAALAEQLQLGQQLKRKIEGRKGSGSDDDSDDCGASTSASDSDGEEAPPGGTRAAAKVGGRARSAALDLLAGGGPLALDAEGGPKKGLLGLPFMKRAMERRRMEAQQGAEQLLRELDEQQQEEEEEGRGGDDDASGEGLMGAAAAAGGTGGIIEALVGYSVPAVAASGGTAGRRRFGGGGGTAGAAAADGADADVDAAGGSDLDSDDAEDAEAKAQRLGRKTRGAAAAAAAAAKQQAAAGHGKKGRKGKVATAPPTAADQDDLDAALAAGAAGRGLLVTSADAGMDLAVDGAAGTTSTTGTADVNAERRGSGRAASTRGGVLAEAEAQRVSLAAGGGRAALFAAGGGKAAAGAVAVQAKYVATKAFDGPRPGYAFKRGPQGLGYYLDGKVSKASAAGQGGKGQGDDASAAAASAGGVVVAGQAKQQPVQGQGPSKTGKAGKPAAAAAEPDNADGAAGVNGLGAEDSDDDDAPLMQPAQKDLIRQAFAGDDVEAEFAAEKAAAVASELPAVDEPSALPGWGAWAGQQRNPKWMQVAKDKAAKQRASAAAGRKDAQHKYVVISEKWDKKAAKYTTPAAPFPFTSQEAYERSLRQPLGREYNPDVAFRDLTRPAVIKQAGVAIAPLRYSEPAAKELRKHGKKAEASREARRVVTVAGGMTRLGKK